MGKDGKSKKGEKSSGKASLNTFDAELDSLFSTAGSTSKPSHSKPTSITKPSIGKEVVEEEEEEGEEEELANDDGELSSIGSDAVISGISDDEEEEEDDEDVVEHKVIEEEAGKENEEGSDSESEEDDDGSRPVHETVLDPSLLSTLSSSTGKSNGSSAAKRKAAIREEPQSQRDARSLFLGNLPVQLASSKSSLKELKRHLIACSPYPSITQIESIRFRSIPFSKPTDDYEAKNPDEAEEGKNKRQRSRSYKEALDEDPTTRRTFLSGSQKRKVAFINQEINDKADSVNAYVTLAQLSSIAIDKLKEKKQKDVSSLTAPALAALLATSVNGTLFEERHIRADLVVALLPSDILQTGLNTVQTADGSLLGASAGATSIDNESRKRTAFIGNLDFEAKEEELRGFFESLITKERGSPPEVKALDFSKSDKLPLPEETEEGSDEAVRRLSAWVYGVRIIRDAATQMGKGFGYVRFLDAACVDEIMAIHESEQNLLAASKSGKAINGDFRRKLKFKGRPLRVSRCKVSKGNVTTTTNANGAMSTPKRPTVAIPHRSRSSGAPTPGGTSPHFRQQQQQQQQHQVHKNLESPTRKGKSAIKSSVPNPKPLHSDPLKTARNAQKRGDPERQAKRLEKKNKKRAELVRLADGGDKSKMKLKVGKGGKFNKKVRRD